MTVLEASQTLSRSPESLNGPDSSPLSDPTRLRRSWKVESGSRANAVSFVAGRKGGDSVSVRDRSVLTGVLARVFVRTILTARGSKWWPAWGVCWAPGGAGTNCWVIDLSDDVLPAFIFLRRCRVTASSSGSRAHSSHGGYGGLLPALISASRCCRGDDVSRCR